MKGTIKTKGEIDALFLNGTKVNGKGFLLIFIETSERGSKGRVAFIAGKKLGSAPRRNYAKRVMRHVAHENGFPIPGIDVIFVAKKQLFDMEHSDVVSDLKRISSRFGFYDS